MPLPERDGAQLLGVARTAIERRVRLGEAWVPPVEDYPESLRSAAGSFVTLKKDGELRGCIGDFDDTQPLALGVARNAVLAACKDPRFGPVQPDELDSLELHISVLAPREPVTFQDDADLLRQLVPRVHGLVIRHGGRQATFLPSVWEQVRSPEEFLSALKRKAGLPPFAPLPGGTLAQRYTVESIG